MDTYTNLTWPDDPYRTAQQLYRKPAPRLAAFAVLSLADPGGPTAAAIVYLPLHRTRALAVTDETVAFGFRAASADDNAAMPALAAIADLDLMQARRHAAILAGYMLARDLAVLQSSVNATTRGIEAVQQEWANRRNPSRGTARMIDCHADLPQRPSLKMACQYARLSPGLGGYGTGPDRSEAAGAAAAMAVDRALAIALICARHLDRYTWEKTLHTARIITAGAWDCLSLPSSSGTVAAVAGPQASQSADAGGNRCDRSQQSS